MLDLNFFDLENLIDKFDKSRVKGEKPLELGEMASRKPKKYSRDNSNLVSQETLFDAMQRISIPIYQKNEIPFYNGKIGDIRVEKGKIFGFSARDSNGLVWTPISNYESLELRFSEPILFENGSVLPPCAINMRHEESPLINLGVRDERKDYQRVGLFGLFFPIEADFAKEVPSEWFYKPDSQ